MNYYEKHKTKIIIISLAVLLLVSFIAGLASRELYDNAVKNVREMFGTTSVKVEYEGSEIEKAKKAIAKEPAVQEAMNDLVTSIYERREADKKLKQATGHDSRARLSADRLTYKYADLMGEEVATSTKK